MRKAISAGVGYAVEVVERGDKNPPPLPIALFAQARVAARNGVGLDAVLRGYFAGYVLVGDFLIGEAERGGFLRPTALQGLVRSQAALFDRLLAVVSEEHAREASQRRGTTEQQRVERVERLLAGELLSTDGMAYDFSAHHIAVIGAGPGAEEAIRRLARSLDCRVLVVPRREASVWTWLGSLRPTAPSELAGRAVLPPHVSLTIGESGRGLAGWRLSHHQAKAALPIALGRPGSTVRYADVALLASMLQDELLVTSLRELYLKPLEGERDGGRVLRETLRAYFAAERNASAAAELLGVTRQTIANRMCAIEKQLGRSLPECGAHLEAALQLAGLDESAADTSST